MRGGLFRRPSPWKIPHARSWTCAHCRQERARYYRERRAARGGGYRPALKARAHLLRLSRHGVGYDAVVAACDVGRRLLRDIRAGRKRRIRAAIERRILSVDEGAMLDRTLVPAGKTWQRIGWLLDEGYTRDDIARRLGRKQLGDLKPWSRPRICAITALKVERLHRLLVGEEETEDGPPYLQENNILASKSFPPRNPDG
jgi:hypothetical protein